MKAGSNESKDIQTIGPTSDILSNLSEDLQKGLEFNTDAQTKDYAPGLFDKMLKNKGEAS